ncbi:hypothetical protein [Acinetobacter baumannii]|uniref:hypothetical protein n=1 Tax=Acinetobacter baumannii TaxID=470 RepID=UPI00034B2806|nr:hypothetical protein [Acinetobacter baumannii]
MDEFEEYYKNSEWFGTYQSDLMMKEAFEAGQQSMQAKVEELKASHHGEVIGHEVHFKKIKQERDELQTLYTQQGINMLKLQKRVDALELKLREIANIAMRARRGEYQTESGRNAGLNIAAQLEQALKGEGL